MEEIRSKIEQYFSDNLHPNEQDFVSRLKITMRDSQTINFSTPNPLFRQWFQTHHRGEIEKLFCREYSFYFEMLNEAINIPQKKKKLSINFNPKFQFKNFLSGSSNIEAFECFKSLADSIINNLEGVKGNFYFLHGHKSSGKTHLLSAFLFKLHKTFDDSEVIFMKTKDFLSSFVFSCREGQRDDFFNSFKNKKVLVLEGIDLLLDGNKSKTQLELAEILDHYITQGGATVILSAERHPLAEKYIPALWAKLCGADFLAIDCLDKQLITKIIYDYQSNHQLNIDEKALEFLKNQKFENYNYLLANLANIKFQLKRELISLEKLQEIFAKSYDIEVTNINDKYILKEVSNFFQIPISDIIGRAQKQGISHARHIFMYLCRELNSSTFDSIATIVKRNHSTVQNAYKKIKQNKDRRVQLEISQIKSKIVRKSKIR